MARLEAEILTLFPGACAGYLEASILGKARESGRVVVRVTDIREHARGRHRVTDDAPYGGGAGMVMKPEPLTEAIRRRGRGSREPGWCSPARGACGSIRRWRFGSPSTEGSSWSAGDTREWTSG